MKIRIASLHKGSNYINEELTPGELKIDDEAFTEKILINGEISNLDSMLDIRLTVSTSGHFLCDRCAIEYDCPIERELKAYVLFRDAKSPDEAESEGLIFVGRYGTEADLTQEIIDCIYLATPVRKLCKPDCKGLCPRCGADWNEETCDCDVQREQ